MKSPNITAGRMVKNSAGWTHGVNSVRNPWNLPITQFKWGVNITVRGGITQTRPGYSMRLSLPAGNLQGGIFFAANKQSQAASITVSSGSTVVKEATVWNYDGTEVVTPEIPYLVFAVGGSVYFAPFDSEGNLVQPRNWEDYKLSGIQLSPTANEVCFVVAAQSVTINTNGDTTIIPSYRQIMVQDGISAPGYWDGSNKIGGQSPSTPIGYWMAFSGNRLWVASGNIVLASDLGNPLSWKERLEGSGRGDFTFPRNITGIVDYVGQNNDTRVVVFTDQTTYSLASGVLDRTQWVNTANFQNTLYPTVGCVAGKSITFQAGLLWWYSQGGLVSADVAAAAYLSSQVLYKDSEMARVKMYFPDNPSGIASSSFENYLLVSVPYLETLNSATMVLDYAPACEWNQDHTPAWCGVWNGTRPVVWTSGKVNGQPRLFQFSVDYEPTNDGSFNHAWEAFVPERVDTYLQINPDGSSTKRYNRIYSQMESALMGDDMDLKEIRYAEVDCAQIGGTVDARLSYRGSRGPYIKFLDTVLLALTDTYQYDQSPDADAINALGLLRTQQRRLVSEEVVRKNAVTGCESINSPDIDKAFSLLIEWCGELGVEALRIFMDPSSEKSLGSPGKPETVPCVVGEDGASENIEVAESPYQEPEVGKVDTFTATETVSVPSNCVYPSSTASISVTATASFTSSVSFADAQQQAIILANQAAQAAIQSYRQQNPC